MCERIADTLIKRDGLCVCNANAVWVAVCDDDAIPHAVTLELHEQLCVGLHVGLCDRHISHEPLSHALKLRFGLIKCERDCLSCALRHTVLERQHNGLRKCKGKLIRHSLDKCFACSDYKRTAEWDQRCICLMCAHAHGRVHTIQR